mgnify:CR=1 FL=1
MKLSKRGRYALRALVYLSLNSDKEKMTLSKIAKENDISTKYLEQIFSNLKSKMRPDSSSNLARHLQKIPLLL